MTPLLIILSSPSGGGKSSLAKAFVTKHPDFVISISVTTRTPRPGEIDGKDYHFTSLKNFTKSQESGEFLETTTILDNCYGTSKILTKKLIEQKQNIIFDVDPDGAKEIKRNWPHNSIAIFIKAPSLEELKSRMIARGQDSIDVIDARIKQAEEIISRQKEYDYIIINNIFEESLKNIENIVNKYR